MKRNRFLTRTIFFLITLFLITFSANITFGANVITGTNAQQILRPRKVYVIWYYAANEPKRGDAAQYFGIHWRTPGKADYITPSNVKGHLQHVVEFFDREVGKTFEFYKSGNEIHVEEIQSNKFYVIAGDTSNAPADHFLDTDGDFWSKAWQDIENNPTLQPFDDLQNIYLVLVQSNYGYLHDDNRRLLGGAITNGGKAMVALGAFETYTDKKWHAWSDEEVKSVIAHELGHIFGLQHDFHTNGIMSYDYEESGGLRNNQPLLGDTHLSKRSRNWLSVHPDFSGNPPVTLPADNPLEIKVSGQPITQNNSGLPPGNDIMLVTNASTGTPQYKIFVQMDDIDGLHQVELRAPLLSTAPHSGSAQYDPTGQQKHYSLATYLTPQGGGGPFPGRWPVVANMTEEIDITQWVEESMKRGEDSFDLIFYAIDKQGNISYKDIDKQGNLYDTHSYTVFPVPVLEVSHPKTSVWVTEETLDGATVLLELKPTGAAYVTDISTIRNAVEVSGIKGVTISTDNVERINDNEIKVTLDFDHSDFDTHANLTFSVAADAITGYIGGELTTELYVLAHEEELHATTQPKVLTEETLDGSEVLLQLNDAATYEDDLSTIQNAVSISGIKGVSVNKIERTHGSSRSITVVLNFDGTELHTDKVLTFSVDAAAIKNYKGDPFTVEVPVTINIINIDEVVPVDSLPIIYWVDRAADKIQRVNLADSNREDLVTQGLVRPVGIALDMTSGKMYWADIDTKKIQRANLDGSNIEDLITQGLDGPSDIALDVAGGKMYWTDGIRDKIRRANLDGSNIEDLVPPGLGLSSIALDVAGGKMYWGNLSLGEIQRANLDGSNVEVFITRGLKFPSGIALDVAGGKIYWTDWGVNKIQRANLNGSNIEDLVTQGMNKPGGLALDVAGGKMYWIDWGVGKIQRANLNGSNIENILTGLPQPVDLALAIPFLSLTDINVSSSPADVNAVPDLVAYYPFDGNSEDTSGNGNHGQIIGTSSYIDGKFGDALALYGDGYVEMQTSDSLHGDLFKTDPFTLAVWVYRETGYYEHVWRSLPVESGHNTLFIFPDEGIISWRGFVDGVWSWDNLCETDLGVFETDTWMHIAVTNDGEKFRIYADGEKVAETDFQETDGGNATYRIGDFAKNLIVDDYAVFSKALSEEEINLMMKTGVAQFLQTTQSGDIVDSRVPEDVNGDGFVNIQDLVAVAAALGKHGENNADVNGDGEVNIQDLVAVAAAFGEVAAAPVVLSQRGAAHITQEEVQEWLTQAQQANLTDVVSLRGIRFLEQLLAALTPRETALLPNYPNPFNPETWIPYQLAKPADVTLTIYDINGRVVRDLDFGHQRAGMYHSRSRAAHWDGRNDIGEPVATGVYFYTLTAGEFTTTRKMLIRK